MALRFSSRLLLIHRRGEELEQLEVVAGGPLDGNALGCCIMRHEELVAGLDRVRTEAAGALPDEHGVALRLDRGDARGDAQPFAAEFPADLLREDPVLGRAAQGFPLYRA